MFPAGYELNKHNSNKFREYTTYNHSCIVCFQITEALSFLHYSGHVLHRNVCPSSILVTKKGTWKLGGLEFTGM